MKVGTYTHLCTKLLGCALLWTSATSAACGSRTSLMQDDAGVLTADASAQQSSSGNTGGRAGSSTTPRAGRSGAAGTGGTAGRATGGRAGRGGRAGETGETEETGEPRGGAGGRAAPRDRDAAADSGEDEPETAGTGGEDSAGSGGESGASGATAGAGGATAGAGGEAGGAGGESGAPADAGPGDAAAGSGGSDAAPVDAGSSEPATGNLTAITPEQTTEICGRIESSTSNLQWTEAVRGWCSRGSLGTPECSASQESCAAGGSIIPICGQTVPDCPDITVEEFVACRTDTLLSFVEYNRVISCDTPPGLPSEPEVPSCVGPSQRCAALISLRR